MRHVRDLARAALALEAGIPTAAVTPPEGVRFDTEDVVFAVTRHRLASLLGTYGTDLGLTEETALAVADLRSSQRQLLLVQQLELGDVQGMVAAAGIPCLVLKGLPLAVQTTGDPGARGPGDIDLLVPPASVPDVHHLLGRHGWVLRDDGDVTPGTWAWNHVLRNACALTYVGPGSNIDLHWRLDTTLDSLPCFDDLWARRTCVTFGGRELPTLGPSDALAQSAFHSAKDRWRWLRSLVDIHRLAGMEESWAGLRSAADLHRLEISTLAVTQASLGLPAGVPTEVLDRIDRVASHTVRRALHDQERPALKGSVTPGLESALNFRYLLAASSTPRDVARSAAAISLPVKVVSGIESRTAWTGVPVATWRRVVRLRQRTAAWVRHEPAATDEAVHTP